MHTRTIRLLALFALSFVANQYLFGQSPKTSDFSASKTSGRVSTGNKGGLWNGTAPGYINVRTCVHFRCDGSTMTVPTNFVFQPDTVPTTDLFTLDSQGCWAADTPYMVSPLSITPSLDTDPLNGVDLLDLIAIHKHILGLEPLTSLSLIAADVNSSRSVTGFDIVAIRRLLTGIDPKFLNTPSWRFVDQRLVFSNIFNPFIGDLPEGIQIVPMDTLLEGEANFWALKVGDVNCTAFPGLVTQPIPRSMIVLELPDATMKPGEIADIPVRFAENGQWLGFQLGLQFDPARIAVEAVLPNGLRNWDEHTAVQPRPGRLNVLWFDTETKHLGPETPAFFLRLRALEEVSLQEVLAQASDARAEAFTALEEGQNIQLRFAKTTTSGDWVGDARPNPTTHGATIPVHLAEPAAVRVDIWDAQGRLVWNNLLELEAGRQVVALPKSAFPAQGNYLWRLAVGRSVKAGKVVVVDSGK